MHLFSDLLRIGGTLARLYTDRQWYRLIEYQWIRLSSLDKNSAVIDKRNNTACNGIAASTNP